MSVSLFIYFCPDDYLRNPNVVFTPTAQIVVAAVLQYPISDHCYWLTSR